MRTYVKVANWALYSTFGPVVSVAVLLAISILLGITLGRANTMQITYDVGGVPMHETAWVGRFGDDPIAGARRFAELQNVSPPYRGQRPQKVARIDYCPPLKLGLVCDSIWPQ